MDKIQKYMTEKSPAYLAALTQIYSNLNSYSERELIEALNIVKINRLVSYYTNPYIPTFTDDERECIVLIVKILQYIYNNLNVQSPITDEEYDKLYEVMLSEAREDIVGSTNSLSRKTVKHRYPDLRGTLDKVHFYDNKEKGKDKRKSIEDWLNSSENRLGRPLRNARESEVYVFPKFDGVSVIFECAPDGKVQRALTRGDTTTNEAVDLSPLFKALTFKQNLWDNVEYGIKTEVVMTQDNYDKLCKKYGDFKSRRSAVSSILNSKDLDTKFLKYLTIVPLRIQNYNTREVVVHPEAFRYYPYLKIDVKEIIEHKSAINTLKESVMTMMGIPLDGAVIQFSDKVIQTALGRDGAINKFEVAYKFPPENKKTKLIEVDFSIGTLGAVTPVARIEPVKINGNTISNVSLGSMDRFDTLQLREGDEVIVKYDIIPYLYIDETCKTSINPYIKAPTHCKYCGEDLVKEPVLRCVNINCPSRVVGKIVNYLDKMNISGISTQIVTTLFDNGYLKCIEDLYSLKDHKASISTIDGFGPKSVENIVKSIENRKEVFDYELLGSLGIPNIGRKIFKTISNIYYIDELLELCMKNDIKKLTAIHGIKDVTANKIITGVIQNYETIQFLRNQYKVKHDDGKYTIKVLFTKIRDIDFQKYLETEKGCLIMDSYNKEVDIIITPSADTSSSKVEKGRKDGKVIMPISEAMKYFGYNG